MTDTALAGLEADLAGIPQIAPDRVKTNSRDFYWFSPILQAELDDKLPDIMVVPETRAQLEQIAAACARHRVPLTVRGGGTGNYGQSVPLQGGVLVSMIRFNRVISSGGGVGRFESGARLLNIDRTLAPTGWELRLFPSTRRLATIGGFVAGGAGGVGSCTWGQLADPGAILGAQLITVEETPRVIELRDREVLRVQHAYGLNGILTEIEMPLAPRYPWAEMLLSFPDFTAATSFAAGFVNAEGLVRKLVSVHEPRVVPYLEKLAPLVPLGHAVVMVMANQAHCPAIRALAADHGGAEVWGRDPEAAEQAAFAAEGDMPPIYEFAWNHTTWHALKIDPAITYLQIRFPQGEEARLIATLQADFADDMMLHLEFQRKNGRMMVSGLPLVPFRSAEALHELMARLRAAGIEMSNPHTCRLDAAGWKRVDAPQAEFKRIADPHALLNPGKLVV